jgi:hypothetical protein
MTVVITLNPEWYKLNGQSRYPGIGRIEIDEFGTLTLWSKFDIRDEAAILNLPKDQYVGIRITS